MNELDMLLQDLAGDSRPASTRAPDTAAPVKDLNELMQDLQDDTMSRNMEPSMGAGFPAKMPFDSQRMPNMNGGMPPQADGNYRYTQGPINQAAHSDLENMLKQIPDSGRNTVMAPSPYKEPAPQFHLHGSIPPHAIPASPQQQNGYYQGQQDGNNQGLVPVAQPAPDAAILATCAACRGPIYSTDLAITALGQSYHQEHFSCFSCKRGLAGDTFFEKGGNPYCEKCMNESFLLPTCAFCGEKIKGKCINALEKTWHPQHFFCSQCGRVFGPGEGFLEHEGKAYCEDDYYNMFSPKCATCDKPILDEVVSALGKSFHAECFICAEPGCKILLTDSGSFFDYNGKPYCELHYHAARGSLCASCQKPITGRCITAIGKKFHPEHFVCAYCKKNLGTLGAQVGGYGSFKEHEGKPYCVNCHVKLYA